MPEAEQQATTYQHKARREKEAEKGIDDRRLTYPSRSLVYEVENEYTISSSASSIWLKKFSAACA